METESEIQTYCSKMTWVSNAAYRNAELSVVLTQFWIVLPQPFECTKVSVQGCVVSRISDLIRDEEGQDPLKEAVYKRWLLGWLGRTWSGVALCVSQVAKLLVVLPASWVKQGFISWPLSPFSEEQEVCFEGLFCLLFVFQTSDNFCVCFSCFGNTATRPQILSLTVN